MCTALETGSLECILQPEQNDGLIPTVDANAVHYENVDDLQTQINRHVKVKY